MIKQKGLEHNRFSNLISELNVSMHQQIKTLTNQNVDDRKSFKIYIHLYIKELINLERNFIDLTQIDMLGLTKATSIDKIFEFLLECIDKWREIKNIDNINLLYLLNSLSELKRNEIITVLDKKSEVCIKFDDTSLCEKTVIPEIQKLAVLLAQNESHEFRGKLEEGFEDVPGLNGIQYHSYDNQDKITLLKINACFPARAIHNISSMKSLHDWSVKHGGYHFCDKYFDNSMDII